MTDTDTPTDAEITRILAEMMGWTPSETDPGYYYDKDGTRHFPEFLTDGNYMLMVIDAMREKGFLYEHRTYQRCHPSDTHRVRFWRSGLPVKMFVGRADTAQRAVGMAAVKAIREGK